MIGEGLMEDKLKRPKASMPKAYKENDDYIKTLIVDMEAGKYSKRVLQLEIPRLFVLDEEHINLPDMTLEELKIVFPYYFDSFCRSMWYWEIQESISLEKFQEIYALSKKKRIPFLLGEMYESRRFAAGKNIQELLNQLESEIMERYMLMILETGIFPGMNLKEFHIQTWEQLMELWKHYQQFLMDLQMKLYWYCAGEKELYRIDKNAVYQETEVEVEWKLIEFLQIRLTDWERKNPLSREEEKVMDSLTDLVNGQEWNEEKEKNLMFLFDEDLQKTRQFIEKNKNNSSSLMFDKPTLYKVWCMARRTVLDYEKNEKYLKYLMQIEKSRGKGKNEELYEVKVGNVTVTMQLESVDRERFALSDFRIEGLEGAWKITIGEEKKGYHPILCLEDIWKKNKYQSYGKMWLEGKEQVEIDIPNIVSIKEDAFEHIKLHEIEIKGVVQEIKTNAFRNCNTLESVKLLSVKKICYHAFENCSNLKMAVIHSPEALCTVNHIRDVFWNCEKLTSIEVPEHNDILKPLSDFPLEKDCIYQEDFLWWPNIIQSGAKKLIFKRKDQGTYYDEIEPESCVYTPCLCENLEEIEILEGMKVLHRQFSECRNLKKIILPESLEFLSVGAFYNCSHLENIVLPKNTEIINDLECSENLRIFEKLIIPENHNFYQVKDHIIYKGAQIAVKYVLQEAKGIVVIPEGVKMISEGAFENCDKITEIVLPDSLEKIEIGAFRGCTSLKKVSVGGNPRIYHNSDSWDGEYENQCEGPFVYKREYVLAADVELECRNLPKRVLKIPEGTQWIDYYEYAGYGEITEVILPKSIRMVRRGAFKDCTNLRRVIVNGEIPWEHPYEVFGINSPQIIQVRQKKEKASLTYRPFERIQDLLKK